MSELYEILAECCEYIKQNNMEKKFKCKDEVIFRYDDGSGRKSFWTFGIFSHYQENNLVAIGNMVYSLDCTEVLPYDGNEHLVGTDIKAVKEELLLKEGDLVYCFDSIDRFEEYNINLGKFEHILDFSQLDYDPDGLINISGCNWNYCIPFSKFNPDDMESTKKEILTVRNGKLVKANLK